MIRALTIPAMLAFALGAVSASAGERSLLTFEKDPTFAFGDFKGHVSAKDGALILDAPKGRGGLGYTQSVSFAENGEMSPVLRVAVGPKHAASRLALRLKDADERERGFDYDLTQAQPGAELALYPEDGMSLSPAAMGDTADAFDPGRIVSRVLLGDFKDKPYDLRIVAVELRAPLPEHLEQRRLAKAKIAAEAEKRRQEEEELSERRATLLAEGAEHNPDGPKVTEIATLGPDMIAVAIAEREVALGGQQSYERQEGDVFKPNRKTVLAWENGKPALVPKSTDVLRSPPEKNQRPQKLGELVGGQKLVDVESRLVGEAITEPTIAEPQAYALVSTDDARYAEPTHPTAVYHKAKPFGPGDHERARRHWVFFKLPEPMREGQKYTLQFSGVNTAEAEREFIYDSASLRSPAVHVSQVGFRPSDPFKRAFLSEWLGTGGAHAFAQDRFELLDGGGKVVFEGAIKRVLAADEKENLIGDKNRAATNVYAMDFGGFDQAGTYRVHVPGVGTSDSFPIVDGVWAQAFQHVMKGLLAHRSGIALEKDLIGYERPRPMHPEDGFVVLETDTTRWQGESGAIDASLKRLLGPDLDPGDLKRLPEAWGGYMDAADWDRRANHLSVSYGFLELYSMFPGHFEKVKLTLPGGEASNGIPDLLDEALWNVSFYQRLQREDGGVRGGVESTEHPSLAQASWQDTLLAGAFEPEAETSYAFAANAAKLAGLLEESDAERAKTLARDAQRAWKWARENTGTALAEAAKRGVKNPEKLAGKVRSQEVLAAVELYRLTQDTTYHDAFLTAAEVTGDSDGNLTLDSAMAYATLPPDLQDPPVAARAREYVVGKADSALGFAEGNAFGLSLSVPDLPMMGWVGYYSVPEAALGPTLPRAHFLTGEEKYLAGALRATNYTVGANPMNMTLTSGLGRQSPQYPMHVDSKRTGQPAPPGIVVYGPHEPTRAPSHIKTWTLRNNLVPDLEAWPAAESYVDVGNWVEMNEYTVHQTIGPSAYYWGYLSARP